MFRLLTILLAIYTVSPGYGAPGNVESKPSKNDGGNRQDLTLNEENAESDDAAFDNHVFTLGGDRHTQEEDDEEYKLKWAARPSALQKKKDVAKAVVNYLRGILTEEGANPYEDEILAELMEKAIIMYDDLFERDWAGVEGVEDQEARVDLLVEEMNKIYAHLDTLNGLIPELTTSLVDEWKKYGQQRA